MKKSLLYLGRSLIVSLIFASFCLHAESMQSLDLLKNRIEAYIINELSSYTEGKVKVVADNIDSRLTLKPCPDDKLEVFNPYKTAMLNTSTMGIKCMEETNHWTLYVPVKINIFKTVLVAKHVLLKGTRLSTEDMYQTEMDTQSLKQGYFINAQELTGQVCKRDIAPDHPLNPYNIELPKLVKRGEQVTITAVIDNLTVSMQGIAIGDGILGDNIKVKNSSSKKIVEAQVSGQNAVKVIL